MVKKILKKIFERGGIKGEYTIFSIAKWVKENSSELELVREYSRTKNIALLEYLKHKGIILNVQTKTNIIPTVGFNVFTRRLAGDTTYSGEVDYGALGTAVSPSFGLSDTQLGNEVYRKQASSQAFDDNIAYIDWFIASGDVADQTFTEFGAFIDGSGAADSGQAWSLLATGGWVKSGSIFISAKYTLTNA